MEFTEKTIKNVLKSVGISLIITSVGLTIFSIILTYTSISEKIINPVLIIIKSISIIIGGIISCKKIKKSCIKNGGLVGLLYMVIMYVIACILNGNLEFSFQSIFFITIGGVFGSIGGIIGINRK